MDKAGLELNDGPRGATSLCLDCQKFGKGRTSYATTYSQLVQGAETGCQHCHWLETALFDQAYFELVARDNPVQIKWSVDDTVQIWEVDGTKRQAELVGLELFTPVGTQPAWSGLAQRDTIPADPGSEASLNLVAKWLQHCLTNHEACQEVEVPALPTRVLDIGQPYPRILETKNEKARYIALSHCWGTEKGLVATTQNIAMLKRKISTNALMKTFRDAILVARALSIQYIWIDSLCIIQDSIDDWLEESSKMWDVYRNSHITIVAASSASDAQGFLKAREHVQTTRILSNSSQLAFGRCFYSDPARQIAFRRHAHSSPTEPLYSRAWTFQERFLSPRMIKFKSKEMEWHCRTSRICECHHYTDNPSRATTEFQKNALLPISSRDRAYWKLLNGPRQEIFSTWRHAIVEPYSGLLLTRRSDRLPAIAGIASLIRNRFPAEEYLYGLWRGDVVEGLHWFRDGNVVTTEACVPASEIPTWSWACAPGAVNYDASRDNPRNQVITAVFLHHTYDVRRLSLLPAHKETPYKQGIDGCAIQLRAPSLRFHFMVASWQTKAEQNFTVTQSNYKIFGENQRLYHRCKFYPDDVLINLDHCPIRSPLPWSEVQRSHSEGRALHVDLLILHIETTELDETVHRCLVLGKQNRDNRLHQRLGYIVIEGLNPQLAAYAVESNFWIN